MGGIVSTSPTHNFPLPTMETNSEYVGPSKLLLNVTIENSFGPIQVLMSNEDTVGDLVKAALLIYDREKRRPLLKNTDPKYYHLHYSPYTLQNELRLVRDGYGTIGLKGSEKLKKLGSRNFFLCSKPPASVFQAPRIW